MKSINEDHNGNKSSKRTSGLTLIGMSVLMGAVLFTFSLLKKVADPETTMTIIKTFLTAGGTLLLGGVVELWAKKK